VLPDRRRGSEPLGPQDDDRRPAGGLGVQLALEPGQVEHAPEDLRRVGARVGLAVEAARAAVGVDDDPAALVALEEEDEGAAGLEDVGAEGLALDQQAAGDDPVGRRELGRRLRGPAGERLDDGVGGRLQRPRAPGRLGASPTASSRATTAQSARRAKSSSDRPPTRR